jgi:peptidoglycan/LPS O-acetylase OafA/YrhL
MNLRRTGGVAPAISGWLDLARGLAAVEVVAFHAYQLLWIEKLPGPGYGPGIHFTYAVLWGLSRHGVAAVMIFFVLSGYLVGGPALVRSLQGRLRAADYFTARATRLYVVVIPALLLSAALYALARASEGWPDFVASHQHIFNAGRIFNAPAGPLAAACNLLFLQTIACHEYAGNLAWWSLANEFWYYVLFFALLSVRRNLWWALPILAILMLFYQAERFDTAGHHTGLQFIFYFAIWCLGVVAYAVAAPAWLWALGFATGLMGLQLIPLAPVWAYYATIGLVTCAAIVGLERAKWPLPAFLRFGIPLAAMSFSLYAIHYPVLLLLDVVFGRHAGFTLQYLGIYTGFMVAGLLVGALFYLGFESRTQQVRHQLRL